MGTITIEIDEKHALVRHIEELQATLAKRNKTIEQLRERLEAGGGSPLIEEARGRGYQEGWKACSNHLTSATHEATRALARVRKEAIDIYYAPVVTTPSDAGDA